MCESKRLMLLKDLIDQFLQTNSECPELFFVDEVKYKFSAWKYGIRCRRGWGLAFIGDNSVVYTDKNYENIEIKACDPNFFQNLLTALRSVRDYKASLHAPEYRQIPPS